MCNNLDFICIMLLNNSIRNGKQVNDCYKLGTIGGYVSKGGGYDYRGKIQDPCARIVQCLDCGGGYINLQM